MMRSVRSTDPALVRRTILLLLAISVMPFAAELLGTYGGSAAIAITIYALVNALALAALLLIDHELTARHLSTDRRSSTSLDLWCDLVAFLLAVAAAYVLAHHGLLSLIVLLLLSGVVARFIASRRARRAQHQHHGAHES